MQIQLVSLNQLMRSWSPAAITEMANCIPYAQTLIQDHQYSLNYKILVASDTDRIYGLFVVDNEPVDFVGQEGVILRLMAVHRDYRRQGIARQLSEHLFQACHHHGLAVRVSRYSVAGAQFKSVLYAHAQQYQVPFDDEDLQWQRKQAAVQGRDLTPAELATLEYPRL